METTRPSLLLRLRDRDDAAAWETFHAIYRPVLLRYARARGLAHEDAEDVAQHVLAQVASDPAAFEPDPERGRFKGWLRTVVNNRVRTLLRDRATASDHAAALADEAEEADDALSPEALFDQLWLQEHLWRCLEGVRAEVDARTWDVYARLVFDEAPVGRVCAELGVEPGNAHTIRWRLTKRVAERMRALTEGAGELDGEG